jgi:hypothetical protein
LARQPLPSPAMATMAATAASTVAAYGVEREMEKEEK